MSTARGHKRLIPIALRRVQQPARRLAHAISSWTALRAGTDQRAQGLPQLAIGRLRRLESRQVLSVTAAFTGGVLDIQVVAGGIESAGLFANGNDFFVDQNSNQTQDVGEVTGLIASIGRLQATSPDQVGSFQWRGDFSRAPLNLPTLSGHVVNIEGFQQTQLQANFRADGNLHIDVVGQVTLGNQAAINGVANIHSESGFIASDINARWSFESSADITARGQIQLAQSSTEQFAFQDLARFESTQDDVQLGLGSNLTLNRLSFAAVDATIQAQGDVALEEVLLSSSLRLRTDGQLSDSLGANLQIQGNLDLSAGSIVLGDDAQDQLIVLGSSQLNGNLNSQLSGLVSIGTSGAADLQSVWVEGHDVTIRDQNSLIATRIVATGDLELSIEGALTDAAGVVIDVRGQAHLTASSIRLSDDFNDFTNIAGATSLVTTGDVLIGPAGSVNLGALTVRGNQIEVTEHADMLIESIDAAQDLTLISSGAIIDTVAANIRSRGDATLVGQLITLADDSTDRLQIDGKIRLTARIGDLAIGSAGLVQMGDVQVEGRNVLLNEDADLAIASIHATGNLTVISSGALTDNVGAIIIATGNSRFTAASITLSDNGPDRLALAGEVALDAVAGDIAIGSAGSVDLGTVSAVGRDVAIYEDAATVLDRVQVANDLVVESSGQLTDLATADLEVLGNSRLQATSILVADRTGDSLRLLGNVDLVATQGDIQVGSAGLVELGVITASGRNLELSEDADTVINSLQATGGLHLVSLGTVTDLSNSSIRVAGTADINGIAITLADQVGDQLFVGGTVFLQATTGEIVVGPDGLAEVGQITAKGHNIELHEDSNSELFIIDATGQFLFTSTGSIQDSIESMLRVGGNSSVTGTSITLADTEYDQLLVGGASRWLATEGDLNLGLAGRVETGDISATATNIIISEDADMSLVDIQASRQVVLISSGAITDQPGVNIQVGGSASLTGTQILLADFDTDQLNVIGDFILRSLPGDIRVGPDGLVTLGQLDVVGRQILISEDADTVVRLLEASQSAELSSSGVLSDIAGAAIQVLGAGSFRAQEIELADSAGDLLSVVGATSFIAQRDVLIGALGQVDLGDVSATAHDLTLTEDEDTALDRVALSGDMVLTSRGTVSDVAASHVDIEGDVSIRAQTLSMADQLSDQLNILGTIDLRILGDILIAEPGEVMLGTINATAANIAIFEDAATVLNNVVSGNLLRLDSRQSIVNLVAADPDQGSGVQAPSAILTSRAFLHLGGVRFQQLTGEFRANGLLGNDAHFGLNSRASEVGRAALDLLDEPTASGEPVPTSWLDGSQLADVQRRFDYEDAFDGQYGFYISNQTALQLGTIQGVGDGLHLYVETLGQHNLDVANTIRIVNTSNANGSMVLIAGDQLSIARSGSLETIAVTGQARDSQRVLVPLFQADAFDGGIGPAGFESTHSVILERALAEDTRYDPFLAGAQNVFQHVSSQFGTRGEAGFLAIIRYADGQTQLFDTYQEVIGSFNGSVGTKGPVGTFSGAIPAHAINDGAAALFARSTPFTDVFLNGVQELPTSVVYRRSTDFFLFENGGSTDVASQVINLDSGSDRVLDVLTNAIPPSFSLPTLIETATPLLPVPIRLVEESSPISSDIDQELETKVEFDATRQVIIYRVGYDDENENGQPEDAELPSREQIVDRHRASLAESKDSDGKQENEPSRAKLAPGQLDARSRDVQKDLNPTPETLDAWIDQYRRDPRIAAGAYSIVEEASRTGVDVLRIFSVRDFDEPTQSITPNAHSNPANEDLPAPRDESSSDVNPNKAAPIAGPRDADVQGQPQSAKSDDLTYSASQMETIDAATPAHAFFLASGLVWLNKQSARAVSNQQLLSLASLPVAFDRVARQGRQQARSQMNIPDKNKAIDP